MAIKKLPLEQPLDKNKKIAFVFSPQLGDSLISMVTAYNLRRNGYDVTVFSDHMFALQHWFANDKIYPYPQEKQIRSTLAAYDTLIFTYPHDIYGQADSWHPNIIILSMAPPNKAQKNMVDIQVDIGREALHLTNLVRTNDLTPPKNIHLHKHTQRVIIHPTSRQKFRSWPKKKFVQLAKNLQELGCQPSFIMTTTEREEWQSIEKEGLELPYIPSLDQVAEYIYESGWFIGNDSGSGHLASNLGLNTVTLVARPGLARLWRPSWMPGVVIFPPAWLITRPLKERFWKNFISVRKVLQVCINQLRVYNSK